MMKCPKCGHGDYNGRCCQECGYPEHQLRSGGSFQAPPAFQRQPVRQTKLPGRAAKTGPSRYDQGEKKSKKGCLVALIPLILIGVVILGQVISTVVETISNSYVPAAPEPDYYEDEWDTPDADWDSDWEEFSIGEVDEAAIQPIVDQANLFLEDRYGSHENAEYFAQWDEYSIFMAVLDDELVKTCEKAQEGDRDAIDAWQEMKEEFMDLSTDLSSQLSEEEMGWMTVDVAVSDTNGEGLLLLLSDGMTIVDAVEDPESAEW